MGVRANTLSHPLHLFVLFWEKTCLREALSDYMWEYLEESANVPVLGVGHIHHSQTGVQGERLAQGGILLDLLQRSPTGQLTGTRVYIGSEMWVYFNCEAC